MALGDAATQNKQSNNEPTYFSRLRIKNPNTKLQIGFSYWKGMLKISISKEMPGENYPTYEECAYVHISPMKSLLLESEIKRFLSADATDVKAAYGIETGISEVRTIIVFKYENEGKDKVMIIGKVDPNGNLIQSFSFLFNNALYNYSCEWKDFNKMNTLNKVSNPNADFDILCTILSEFRKGAMGGIAYSVMDMQRFDYNSVVSKLTKIMSACGVNESGFSNNGKQTGRGSNSYFDSSNGFSQNSMTPPLSTETTYDNIEAIL